MYLITILANDGEQLECSVGSFKEALDFAYLCDFHPGIIKYKISSSMGVYNDHLKYFDGRKKFCEKFYEEGELIQ